MVNISVNKWECLEEHIKNRVGKGEIRACCGDNGLKENHSDGPRQGDGCHLLEALFFEIFGSENVGISSLFAESSSFSRQENRPKRFGNEEKGRKTYDSDDQCYPEHPSPSKSRACKATD